MQSLSSVHCSSPVQYKRWYFPLFSRLSREKQIIIACGILRNVPQTPTENNCKPYWAGFPNVVPRNRRRQKRETTTEHVCLRAKRSVWTFNIHIWGSQFFFDIFIFFHFSNLRWPSKCVSGLVSVGTPLRKDCAERKRPTAAQSDGHKKQFSLF